MVDEVTLERPSSRQPNTLAAMRSVSASIPVDALWELYDYNPLTGKLWSKRWFQDSLRAVRQKSAQSHYLLNGKKVQTNYGRVVYAGALERGLFKSITSTGISTDNRIQNLRDADSRLNNQNKRNHRGGASYHHRHQKWYARITIQGKKTHLGTFPTQAEAQQAYKDALNALEAP